MSSSTTTTSNSAVSGPIRGDSGVLITCDAPMKQYILYLNEKERPQFVIADLDSTHLLIRDVFVEKVQQRIAQYVEEQNIDTSSRRRGGKQNT